jgi:hypothetical protein
MIIHPFNQKEGKKSQICNSSSMSKAMSTIGFMSTTRGIPGKEENNGKEKKNERKKKGENSSIFESLFCDRFRRASLFIPFNEQSF